MRKILALGMAAMLLLTAAGCSKKTEETPTTPETPAEQKIDVISREEGSGTRGAFIELFGIEQKDASGNKVDMTIDSAEINSSTSVVITTVAGDPAAIGYISLGSLNDTVKAVKIDGVAPSAAAVKDGTYTVSRPFNIATKGELSAVAKDFVDFILSAEGQAVIEKNGYISTGNTGAYAGNKPAGSVTVAGSSSVTPVMEKLKEAYIAINTGASIDIQQSDSTTGMTSAIDGICDIGMASRELKDSELEKGLTPTVIAMDGIAVIVNKENTVADLTKADVLGIYTGTITDWSEIQ
ncbi:Phosphate-binding protein PstS 2 [bioreactor metagenome]|uniref:Phosphate-binding protein PstS 2 n=1 Tax=bioreactor metagenome TaxID=1076179 RepID=A0A645BDI4_9ZZZZ